MDMTLSATKTIPRSFGKVFYIGRPKPGRLKLNWLKLKLLILVQHDLNEENLQLRTSS